MESQAYKPWIYAVVELQQWGTFAEHPQAEDVVLPLVQEFVTNFPIGEPEPTHVVVRGVSVTIDPETIREVYDIDEVLDDFDRLKKLKKNKKFRNKVAKVICGDNRKKWELGKELIRGELCPEAQVWITFIRGKMIPTLHDTTISLERGILLYCLLTGKFVDLGPIVYKRMCEDAKHIKHIFFFADLVKRLCERAGVRAEPHEARIPLMLPITAQTVNRILKSNDAATFAKIGAVPPPCVKPVPHPPNPDWGEGTSAARSQVPPPTSAPSPATVDLSPLLTHLEKLEMEMQRVKEKDRARKIALRELKRAIRKHRIRNLDLCTQLEEKWRLDKERYELGPSQNLPTFDYPAFPYKVMDADFDEVYGYEPDPEPAPAADPPADT